MSVILGYQNRGKVVDCKSVEFVPTHFLSFFLFLKFFIFYFIIIIIANFGLSASECCLLGRSGCPIWTIVKGKLNENREQEIKDETRNI